MRTTNNKGFTLIEIVVALTIFAAVAIVISQTMSGIFSRRGKTERRAEGQHALQVGLMKLFDDINMAFLSDTTFQGKDTDEVTAFAGAKSELNFSTMSHIHYVKNRRDSDQVNVGYSLVRGTDGLDNLVRRESDHLMPDVTKGGQTFTLIPDVKEFTLSYYDANQKEWKEGWNTDDVATAGALPSQVKIHIVVYGEPAENADDKRREYEYEMIVPVEMYAQKISF